MPIEQALLLRGNHNFESAQAYQAFIDDVVAQHNRRNAQAISIERQALQSLPSHQTMDYTEIRAVVTSSSTIDVRRVTYTVPSRLQGETLQVRLYHDRLECYLGHQEVIKLHRIYPTSKTTRARVVDYRHVIHSLIKKPQAFRYSQIRNDLLPNSDYCNIWQCVDKAMQAKPACKFMVGLLYLAATDDCEQELARVVLEKINNDEHLSLSDLQNQFRKSQIRTPPDISIEHHTLASYNQLIPTVSEVLHA